MTEASVLYVSLSLHGRDLCYRGRVRYLLSRPRFRTSVHRTLSLARVGSDEVKSTPKQHFILPQWDPTVACLSIVECLKAFCAAVMPEISVYLVRGAENLQ